MTQKTHRAARAALSLVAILLALVVALGVLWGMGEANKPAGAQEAAELPAGEKPNVLFVETDDMRADEIEYMPNVLALAQEGMTFSESFATTSQCCPSRASALRGQYVHNHRVLTNESNANGGVAEFNRQNNAESTIATWLDDAGYETGLFGKYLNGCGSSCPAPPGWDHWKTNDQMSTTNTFDHAEAFLKAYDGATADPFFMWVAPFSPHGPLRWPNAYDGTFLDAKVPRVPSINEADVSDKPDYIRENALKNMDKQDKQRRGRARMLAHVDDRLGSLRTILEAKGQWENTVVVFTSDNGYHQGEHRAVKKNPPYEESIRVPMIVKGPGVGAGQIRSEPVLNIDLAPTFAELGGATPAPFVDGRSFAPLLRGETVPWRSRFGIEFWKSEGTDTPPYYGVRTATGKKYVNYYTTGEKEYYDLAYDPYELENNPAAAGDLEAQAEALRTCAADTCRSAEDG